jgi:hypothetical protein
MSEECIRFVMTFIVSFAMYMFGYKRGRESR